MGGRRVRDDAGGVWITVGWVLGVVVYAGVVLSWHAGFTAATPFVVIPPVLLIMIAAGNWIGGRRSGRPAPRFNRPDPVPVSVLRGGPPPAPDPGGSGGSAAPGAAAPPDGAAPGAPVDAGPSADGADGAPAGGPGPGR